LWGLMGSGLAFQHPQRAPFPAGPHLTHPHSTIRHMARPLRIEFPGAVYHVTSRGNARAPIFRGDADRYLFLGTLGDVVEQHGWLCHAYCLMTNHYHLLLETPGANLSRGMRELNGIYYRWSSLRATLGLVREPAWLVPETLLESFGSATRYAEFVREGIGAGSPWGKLRGSLLGSEQFARRMCKHLREGAAQREVPRRERLVHREPLDRLFPRRVREDRRLRNERIREVRRNRGYTLTELARHLGLHYGTVSRIATAGL